MEVQLAPVSSCSITIMFSGLTDTGTSFIRRSMFSLRYVG